MKKITAFILALSLLASLGVTALAARDTSFFTPSEHTELNFSDLSYEPVEVDAALAIIDRARALSVSADYIAEVRRLLSEAIETSVRADDMETLTYILMCRDPASDSAGDYVEASTVGIRIRDALYVLISDLLDTPCAEVLKEHFTEEELAGFANYKGLGEEEIGLREAISEKTNEFWTSAGEAQSAEELYRKRAEIYIDTVRLNREWAELNGWDSYAEYAYLAVFGRDFTPADAEGFAGRVREYIVPVFNALNEKYQSSEDYDYYYVDHSGSAALDEIEPYIAEMSDELAESLKFMRDHGFYDSSLDAKKSKQGFTTTFLGLNAPFFFYSADGNFDDLTTTIHELGHYNRYYWCCDRLGIARQSIDICEVHSQALELLFTRFYPALLDDEAAGLDAREHLILSKLDSIVTGAIIDELERWCYAQESLTPEAITYTAAKIIDSYGLSDMISPDFWVNVPHIYENPFYYISYAVSAAGAFAFWLDAERSYYSGVDDYLRFAALPDTMSFNESFGIIGVDSPMSGKYLARLADAISYDMRLMGWYYDDVSIDDWYFAGVKYVCEETPGEETGLFLPDEIAAPEFAEAFLDNAAGLSRIGIVCALYEKYGEGEIAIDSPFSDLTYLTLTEKRAVDWAFLHGITKGTSLRTFDPDAPCTRAMLATMLCRAAEDA